MHEEVLIKKCKRYNKLAQKELYERYVNLLRGVCVRYASNTSDAEDLLHECFIKILTRIAQFQWKGDGSFKSWMIRIVINTAISNYKKNKKRNQEIDYESIKETNILNHEIEEMSVNEEVDKRDINTDKVDYEMVRKANFTKDELLEALNRIPETFRLVFNLHIIEGCKHEEIADMMGVEIKTSRSRLSRARKLIQHELYQMSIKKLGR